MWVLPCAELLFGTSMSDCDTIYVHVFDNSPGIAHWCDTCRFETKHDEVKTNTHSWLKCKQCRAVNKEERIVEVASQPGFLKSMEDQGYFGLCHDAEGNVFGLQRMISTIAITCYLTPDGYEFRYCYGSLLEARLALTDWEESGFEGQPKGYIKRKG